MVKKVASLTRLLKKEEFSSNEEENETFEMLELTICTTPLSATHVFTKMTYKVIEKGGILLKSRRN